MERSGPAAAVSAEVPAGVGPVGLASGPLGAVQAADREIARWTAVRARAVAEFAGTGRYRRIGRRGSRAA